MAHNWSDNDAGGGTGGGNQSKGGTKKSPAAGRKPSRKTVSDLKAQTDADFANGLTPF